MPTSIPLRGKPRMLLAAAAWTLLILSLFVMHGAGSHGTTTHASAPVADGLGIVADDVGHHGVAPSGDPAQDSEDDHESPGHSAAELCLAILCALLSALAAFVALSRSRRHLFRLRRAVTPLVPPWLRPCDPPCLIRLSIQRC